MSARSIGLDIGTYGVRAVQLGFAKGRPVLEKFAQVALPPGAIREGEIVDGPAVSAVIRRLWREVGFKSNDVVIGVGNQRVLVRQVELPAMSRAELAAALPFEAQELIPIPVEDAVLDFQVLGEVPGPGDGKQVRLLLAAAHREMVEAHLAVVTAAGLKATSVEVGPLAMVRSLAGSPGDGRADAIVSIGAGVTSVVVHEGGVPRFVRVIPIGSNEVTEAIAKDLGVDTEVAEGLKRRADLGSSFETVARAGQLVCDRLGPLGGEIRESLAFYSAQSHATPIARVLLTGGGSTVPGVLGELRSQLDLPVDLAHPLVGIESGRAGFTVQELDALEALMTVPLGLALAGRERPAARGINLVPKNVPKKAADKRQLRTAGTALVGLAGVLALALVAQTAQLVRTDRRADSAEVTTRGLQRQEARLSEIAALVETVAQGETQVRAAVTGELAWTNILRTLAAAMPPEVSMTNFAGSVGSAVTPGTITIAATGADQSSTARWLLGLGTVPSVGGLWVSSSTVSGTGPAKTVTFSGDASFTDQARSDRARQAAGGRP